MKHSFYSLSPDTVLNAVEEALSSRFPGSRATGKAFALNSLENRVFEIELEDEIMGEQSVVAKFYRPHRWSKEQILEEHAFIHELKKSEVPAVEALTEVMQTEDGIYFVVFPKIRGRLKDELNPEELRQLGRLLGRLHSVGERFKCKDRRRLDIQTFGGDSLALLEKSKFMDENTRVRYSSICKDIFSLIEPMLKNVQSYAVHGDCHAGNILWNEMGPFFLDFDDMVIAPPVQDIWMIVKGRDQLDIQMREELIQSYELIKDFDRSTLSLIEPLRALRMIHYSAWIANRWQDPSFPQMFQHFETPRYWSEEIQALDEVLNILRFGHNYLSDHNA